MIPTVRIQATNNLSMGKNKRSFNFIMGHNLGTYSIKWIDPNGRPSKK